MSAFRIVIVDGEAIARQQLRGLVSLDRECEIVGEFANGREAIASIGKARPDILFVDLHMDGMDGFAVARAAGDRVVILTSAVGDLAVRAFEERVFDYLVKPVGEARFLNSLERAKIRVAATADIHFRPHAGPQRLAVRRNGRVVLLMLDEIDWIEAADNYVCLHCGRETHVLRETMAELEFRLDPARFVRVHRSAIVNIDRIRELQPWFRGDYRVVLLDGTELTLTKNHHKKLDAQLLMGSLAH